MSRDRVAWGLTDAGLSRRRFLELGALTAGAAVLGRDPAEAAQKPGFWAHGASVDHHNIPVYVGLAKGIWREEGIDLTAKMFEGGGPMVQAMVAGQLPIATGGISTVMNARAGGLRVKYIATVENTPTGWGLVAIDPAVRSVKDLKGKRIGTGKAGAISHWWGLQVAKWQGWAVGKDVEVVGVGGANALQAALLSKQVDAILVWPPGFPILKSKVGETHWVVTMNDVVKQYLGDYESEGWFATEKYIETDADAIQRTLRGYCRSVKYCQDHPDEAAQIAAKEWNLSPAVVRVTVDENVSDLSLTGVPSEKGMQVVLRSLVEQGMVKTMPALDEVLDRRFTPVKL
jgi:NitT/TauT family transport system substrate-binding protein